MAMNPRGSEAYDLSLFEPKKAKIIPLQPNKKMQKAQKRQARLRKMVNAAVTLCVSAVVLSVVTLRIVTRVQLTELNTEIASRQAELEILISETKTLTNELAMKTSAQSVEDYIRENGMQKVESHQIQYLSVASGDEIEVADTKEVGWLEKLCAAVAGLFQ